jgi:DNA polymerase I-like protein with 3'-5' exonuclease and polymerase domains
MNRKINPTIKELRTLGPVIALDFETTSLNYLEMEFVGFSVCDGINAYYCTDIMKLPIVLLHERIVFHNAVYDLKCCRKFLHTEPLTIFCTLVENRFGKNPYSLKTLAVDWLGKTDVVKYDEVSHDPTSRAFAEYAMDDAVNTYELYQYEYPKLDKEGLLYLAEEIEMPFQKCLADLEINGIAVDLAELERIRPEIETMLEASMINLCDEGNIDYWYNVDLFGNKTMQTAVNFNSPTQLVEFITQKLGFEITERTKKSKTYPKGQLSFGKKSKERLKNKHPFFTEFMRYSELDNLLSSFVGPCGELVDSDGRLRTSYGLKRTGRLSSSKPNVPEGCRVVSLIYRISQILRRRN